MNVIEYLNRPKAASLSQRISIKSIVDFHQLKRLDEKLLRDHIRSIYLIGVLNESTIHVRPFIDESMKYEEIHVLYVILKKDNKFSQLNQKLHVLFPNPTLIIFLSNDHHTYSTAIKHLYPSKKNQAVIDEVFMSEPSLLEDEVSQKFLKKTDLTSIKVSNLKEFYDYLINTVYQQRLISIIHDYPESILNTDLIKKALKNIENLNTQLNQLKADEKSLKTMRSKMENNMKQKQTQSNIDSVVQTIKEAIKHG